jgi:hypothetical protein
MVAVLSGTHTEFLDWLKSQIQQNKIHPNDVSRYRCICNKADHIGMVFSEVKTIGTAEINPMFDSNFIEEIKLRARPCLQAA